MSYCINVIIFGISKNEATYILKSSDLSKKVGKIFVSFFLSPQKNYYEQNKEDVKESAQNRNRYKGMSEEDKKN